jgi:DNA repair exonuclease SbcCD ATPase subunit
MNMDGNMRKSRKDAPPDVEKELIALAKKLRNSGQIELARECLTICSSSQLRIEQYRAVIRKWTKEAEDGTCPVCGAEANPTIDRGYRSH